MESKWFIIIFALLSFLYRQYKKMNEKKEEAIDDSQIKSQSPELGLNDLIARFEKKFVSAEEPQVSVQSSSPVMEETKIVAPILEKEMSESKRESKEAYFIDNSQPEIQNEPESEMDLKQMIITQAILNRPEY